MVDRNLKTKLNIPLKMAKCDLPRILAIDSGSHVFLCVSSSPVREGVDLLQCLAGQLSTGERKGTVAFFKS